MAKTRRPAGTRAYPQQTELEGGLEGGRSDISDLKDEMTEWKDSLESNNMEHLPKYEEVQEAADLLDTVVDTLEGLEVPELPEGDEFPTISYTIDTRQSAQSRAGRMSNALLHLQASADSARNWLEENPELELHEVEDGEAGGDDEVTQEEVDARQEAREAVEQYADELEGAIGEAESVCFPGMY